MPLIEQAAPSPIKLVDEKSGLVGVEMRSELYGLATFARFTSLREKSFSGSEKGRHKANAQWLYRNHHPVVTNRIRKRAGWDFLG